MDTNTISAQAVQLLKQKQIIVIPTEIGDCCLCCAIDKKQIDIILSHTNLKEAEIALLTKDIGMLERYVIDMPLIADQILEATEKVIGIQFDKIRNTQIPEIVEEKIQVIIDKSKLIQEVTYRIRIALFAVPTQYISKDYLDTIPFNIQEKPKVKNKLHSVIKLKNNGVIKIIRE